MAELKLISAESVTEGHPDEGLRPDFRCDSRRYARAGSAFPCRRGDLSATVGQFFVFGEVTSEGYSDIQNIVRSVGAQYRLHQLPRGT